MLQEDKGERGQEEMVEEDFVIVHVIVLCII